MQKLTLDEFKAEVKRAQIEKRKKASRDLAAVQVDAIRRMAAMSSARLKRKMGQI